MSALSLRKDLNSARQVILDVSTEAKAHRWCAWAMNRLPVTAVLVTLPFLKTFRRWLVKESRQAVCHAGESD